MMEQSSAHALCTIKPLPGIQQLKPYLPGKPIDELERELGISNIVKLASNENPNGPSPIALATAIQHLTELTRYPDGIGFYLKNALAHHLSIDTECLTLGNGSNDVLEMIARTFITSEDEVIFSEYAFAVYGLVTQALNAKSVMTKAKDWGHNLNAMLHAITEKTKIIFIANPNNPTGTYIPHHEIKAFLDQVPTHILVVFDEAYHEYQIQQDYQSALTWLNEFSNLIITRTFSKAYGLAALRVGYGISHPTIADYINRIRQPFNVNAIAQAVATAVLDDAFYLEQSIQHNATGLKMLTTGIEKLGLQYIPSVGNFMCIDFNQSAGNIYQALLQKGIIVRPVANYNMPNHLRVSVGTTEENQVFLNALEEVINDGVS